LLLYLHPIVLESDGQCTDNSELLTVVCSIVLCYAVVSGDLADCFQMWEYLRLIPQGKDVIVFESKQSRGSQPVEMWSVKSGGITHPYRLFTIFLYVFVRGSVNLAVLLYGIGYIAIAESDDDKIKDCVAFLILTDLDGIFYKMAVPNIVKTDLERLPVLCLDPDQSTAYTLFSWLWNQFGAWIKPTFVALWAFGLERCFCLGGLQLLAYSVLGVAAFGCCCFLCGSACHGSMESMGKLDVRNVAIGAQDIDPELSASTSDGSKAADVQSIGQPAWRSMRRTNTIGTRSASSLTPRASPRSSPRNNPHAGIISAGGATPWAM